MTVTDERSLDVRTALTGRVRDAEAIRQDWDPARLAAYVLRYMSASERDEYLVTVMAERVRAIRRDRAHDAEMEAEWLARVAEREAACARWEAGEPARRAAEEAARAERHARYERQPWTAPRRSRWYRAWAETPEGQRSIAREEQEARVQAEDRARREREIEEAGSVEAWHQRRLSDLITGFADEVRERTRLELTMELLSSEFALGDGRSVTWGAATITEHSQRVELLRQNVSGNLATIRRHEAAISMIAERQAATLGELAPTPEHTDRAA